jgi:diadenylate cyclase
MEKFNNILREATEELTTREFQDMVTIFDVCRAVQRCEMVNRIGEEFEPYILELGDEGRLIELQLNEMLQPLQEAELVIKDYIRDRTKITMEQAKEKLRGLEQQELINLGNIAPALGFSSNLRSVDTYLSPRGYRVLTQTHRLPEQIIENLVERFGTLQAIMRAPKEDLVEVDGVGEVMAERVRVGLNQLSQLTLGRR